MNMFLDFFSHFEQFVTALIGFVIMMSIVVFIHEFGHYYVARLCGVKILDFSIGFGKKIFTRVDKKGTKWSLSLVPLGGYVQFWGDRSVASDENKQLLEGLSTEERAQTFFFKPIWQKILIILAGPLANILLCFFILFSLNFFVGILSARPIIQDVVVGGSAHEHALQPEDLITHVDGNKVNTTQQVKEYIDGSFGDNLNFTIQRDTQAFNVKFPPKMVKNKEGHVIPIIGVVFNMDKSNVTFVRHDFHDAFFQTVHETYFIASITMQFFKRLFMGKATLENISGPIKIGDAAGVALKSGVWHFLLLMALISMSIGIVNLLPVPMLDGGHLVIYLFELIGINLNANIKEYLFKIGFCLIILVMAFTIINDIKMIGWPS